MPGVTGIGGIFFKARDPKALGEWYRHHLGIDVLDWGGAAFEWGGPGGTPGTTIWSPFAADTAYFGPAGASFMVNFRVDDLDALLASLREAGCAVEPDVEVSEFGRFGWVTDPEGHRVELWQPPPGR